MPMIGILAVAFGLILIGAVLDLRTMLRDARDAESPRRAPALEQIGRLGGMEAAERLLRSSRRWSLALLLGGASFAFLTWPGSPAAGGHLP